MSTQVLFDQFAYTDRLKAGGFTDDQARASAEALRAALTETVATKNDLSQLETALRADIDQVRNTIDHVEVTLKADINELRLELKTMVADAIKDMTKELHSATYKALGAVLTFLGIFTAIAHYWK